jgi:hypothetical protein
MFDLKSGAGAREGVRGGAIWRLTQRFDGLFSSKGRAAGKRRGFLGLSRDTIAKMCRYSAPPGFSALIGVLPESYQLAMH